MILRIRLCLGLLFSPGFVFAAPHLTLGNASAQAGTPVTLNLAIDPTPGSVSALQFNITLPASLSTGTVTGGSVFTAAGKIVSTNKTGNIWTFVIYGMNQTAIAAGNVLTLQLKIAAGTPAGSLSLPLSSIIYADANGNAVAGGTSTGGTITVQSGPANQTPTATSQSLSTAEDTAKAITLSGTDPEGSALTYAIATSPAHGSLSGTGAAQTYTPLANYNGTDSFTFKVNDGSLNSPSASVALTITAVNDAPVANMTATPASGAAPLLVTFNGNTSTDIDGTVQTYAWDFGDGQTGSGVSANHTYAGTGSYTAVLTVTDNGGLTDTDSRVISVSAAVNQAPAATPQAVSTAEDTAKVITLAGTDPEGHALTFIVVTAPTHGSLSGTGSTRTYTPAANYNGPDSFTFKVNDGQSDSPTALVSLTVTSVNDAPIGNMTAAPATGSAPLAVSFNGSASTDGDGTVQTYAWNFGDGQTATGLSANHTYTTAGSFTAVLTVTDNGAATDTDARVISVSAAINQAPTATPQTVSTAEDTAKTIALAGTDPEGHALTFIVVTAPTHGTLSGTGSTRTYTPATNYNGSDSFTFKVNDGQSDSPAALVSLTVTPVNDAPIATVTATPTSGAAPLAVSFSGTQTTDVDGTIQTYTWNFGDGQTGNGVSVSHTYTTAGSFTAVLTVTDNGGATDTDARLISVNVPVNQQPTATPQAVSTAEDTAKAITLAGTDPEASPLSFIVVAAPTHGTLSGTGATRTYTPATNYNGSDSFTFKVNDGQSDSLSAAVTLTVTPVNDAPIATVTATPTSGAAPLVVSFSGTQTTDVDGTIQTYAWNFGDGQTGSGVSANHTYTTAGSFTAVLTVTDNGGATDTDARLISVNVPVNQQPTATPQAVSTAEDTAKAITLAGTDPEGHALTFIVVSAPTHGTLSGTGATRTYTPATNYNGPDSFTFKVNDGQSDSPAALASLTVTPVNDAPIATVTATPTSGAAPLAVSFSGTQTTDVDGTIQTYAWNFGDGQTATSMSTNHTYTTAGSFTAVLTVTDNGGLTDTDARLIVVNAPPNLPPVAQNQPNITTSVNSSVPITLTATDPEHAPLTFTIRQLPAHGFLSGTAPNVIYTPITGYSGADSFKFRANDGAQNSNSATVSIAVTPVEPPAPVDLPPVDLSALDGKSYALTDEITFAYPLTSGVSYEWTFTPVTAGAAARAYAGSVAAQTTNATFQSTPAPRFRPTNFGLAPGVYHVTVKVTQGSLAATGEATVTLVSANLSSVQIYPNPWRVDKHRDRPLTIANLSAGTTVKFFTASGHLAKTLHADGGSIEWNLTNENGQPVASGVYIYLVTDGQGNKHHGKVAIVR